MTTPPKNKSPAVIAALHKEISRANPCLPGIRGRNKIAETTSAALADEGLVTLPARMPGQKQPKARNLEELSRITEAHLQQIVEKWEFGENVRAVLLQKETSEKENPQNGKVDKQDIAALCAALIAALNEGAISPDDMGLIRKLMAVAKGFLNGSAPKKHQDPRTTRASHKGSSQGKANSKKFPRSAGKRGNKAKNLQFPRSAGKRENKKSTPA